MPHASVAHEESVAAFIMNQETEVRESEISKEDRQLLEKLWDVINGNERPVLLGREGAHIQFPEPVFHHLTQIVRAMLQGQSVSVLAEEEALTTQAAANFLGVSRPHLVKMLEEGQIPFDRVGSHRRVRLVDLQGYHKRRDAERRKSLDKLTKRIDAEGYYTAEYTGSEVMSLRADFRVCLDANVLANQGAGAAHLLVQLKGLSLSDSLELGH